MLVSGGAGIVEALSERGLDAVGNDRELEAPVAAVVCGMDRAFDYDRLDRAARAVREGARFVATNTDATYPGTDHGRAGRGRAGGRHRHRGGSCAGGRGQTGTGHRGAGAGSARRIGRDGG